jgi:predicted ATPase
MMAFVPGVTVIQAANGFGKSALLKSLYDTFGAEPHRIASTVTGSRSV